MIVLKKIDFLRPLLLHASMLTRFSEEAKREQLSVSAQKAVWATSIIKTITQASLPASLRDPTLRDLILSLPNPSTEFHFDKTEKKEVIKLFAEGISQASPLLQHTSRRLRNWPPQIFIFFPNRTVTTQMFKELMKPFSNPSQNLLLVGGSGISKAVSIILFIHLSYHQTRFIYQASKDDKKKEEYDKLVKLGLVPDKVVKYWYQSNWYNTDKQIKQLLQKQAVELEPAVRAELMEEPQLRKFIEKLRSHYKIPNLLQRPIVDQMEVDQNRSKYYKSPKFKMCQSFKSFLTLGTFYTLVSQLPINRKMLKKASNDTLNLDLVDSQRGLKTVNISYEKTILTKAGQFDFWQIFWFEIERRANLSPTQLESAKQTFYRSIQSREFPKIQKQKQSTLSIFSRYVYITNFLSKDYQYLMEPQANIYSKLMKSIISQEDKEVQRIIGKFHPFSLRLDQSSINFFLRQKIIEDQQQNQTLNYTRNGEQKHYILLKLYLKACKLKEKEQYRFSSLILTIPQLEQIIYEDIPSYKSPQNKRQLDHLARYEIYYLLEFQTEQAVKFNYNLEEFAVLTKQILFHNQPKNLDFLKSQKQKQQWNSQGKNYTNLGFAPEKYLIECLVEEGSLSFNAILKPSYIQTDKRFKIYQVVSFDELSNIRQAKQGESAFEWHFRSAIQRALKNPGKDILALPYFMTDGQRIGYAEQNPAVDFAILRYNKKLNRFQIESFDVTVSRDLTQKMLQARNLFTELFEGVTSINGIPFSLNHTYLCPKDANYQQQVISNAPPLAIPLTIMYADLLDLTVTTKNFCNLSMFQYIIKLITPEKEEEEYSALLRKHDL